MTTLQIAAPVAAQATDTREAQEARWNDWTSRGAAADRITQSRMRIAFAVLLIAQLYVTIALLP